MSNQQSGQFCGKFQFCDKFYKSSHMYVCLCVCVCVGVCVCVRLCVSVCVFRVFRFNESLTVNTRKKRLQMLPFSLY